jgi:hypothetical protein
LTVAQTLLAKRVPSDVPLVPDVAIVPKNGKGTILTIPIISITGTVVAMERPSSLLMSAAGST